MPEHNANTDSPSIARVLLSSAATELQHGILCNEARLSLQVSGSKRRLFCINCEHFIQLPVGDDYDLAWIEVGQEPLLERIAAMPAPAELSKNTGVCFHGVPMARECPQCAADQERLHFAPGAARPLNGRIAPPEKFNGEGL